MTGSQLNKIVWLVNTIMQHGKITFEDINRKWVMASSLSDGKELPKRTLHKWVDAVYQTFSLIIENEKCGNYRYFISNKNELRNGCMEKWLIDTYSVSNALIESAQVKDRIILEDIPSGRVYLEEIIEAMKENRMLHITYYNYWRNTERNHCIDPYIVKLFRQRWYVVANLRGINKPTIFSLDRIRDLRVSEHQTFIYPTDFSPEEFFDGCYGIIAGDGKKAERVKLKVCSGQANYIRDLPMHESQKEIERNDQFSIFQLHIRPTFDFQQEILCNGEDIEVLEPLWLRKEIAGKIKRMCNIYKED